MFQKIMKIACVAICMSVVGCSALNPISPIVSLGIMWYQGEAHKYYATEQESIYEATKKVLEEFKLPIVEEERDEDVIRIKAGDDDRFKIKITAVRDNVTKLSIRINIMGDHAYAEMIFRHVDDQPGIQQFASLTQLNDAMENRPRLRR
jgi:hypothetical protein